MTINCLGKLIDLEQPRIMGILNLTPDSFYDGGRFNSSDLILKQAAIMLEEGATFIDLGAYSSRPGAAHIPEEEELARLLPVVDMLISSFPGVLLSVDTFRSSVAERCLDRGVAAINDISAGGLDPKMMATVASYRVPYIMMHMKGRPQDMQEKAQYEDPVGELLYYFSEKLAQARLLGINDCILDPGFGFAKTIDQNYMLLWRLDQITEFGFPLMVGLSRKSMIYHALNSSAKESLNGTTALNMVALLKGARILRVHDVKEAMECVSLYRALQNKY